jgi:trehalose 6-phosphate synthase
MPSRARFDESWPAAYRKVNEQFADTIAPDVREGDRIWVHDYHLMLLPRLLRDRLANVKDVRIGFFLHTPFTSEDAFAILPIREAICDGLLSCDLLGFHIRDYVDTFLDAAAGVIS